MTNRKQLGCGKPEARYNWIFNRFKEIFDDAAWSVNTKYIACKESQLNLFSISPKLAEPEKIARI